MRPRLLHPRSERRRSRRRSRRTSTRVPASAASVAVQDVIVEQRPIEEPRPMDPAVARVREAGGPLDSACYRCQCGFVFTAKVSTTVSCPHCGTGQAW
ncbi:MAG TPA: hypothetical protein VG010_08870 [Solirubrobacteraceae bacterium]|nr:hypothetical protein [Solirubrobacteraceae bacterium]